MGSRLALFLLLAPLAGAQGASAITFAPEVYFPLEPGSFWVYEVNLTEEEVTVIVLEGFEFVNGVPTSVVELTGGEFSGGRENFTNDENGLRLHKLFVPGPDGGTAVFRPPVLFSAVEMELGESVRSSGRVDLTTPLGSATIDYRATFTVVGQEVVEVPAGSFNTIRVDDTMILSGFGEVERSDGTTWLAANIGQVKEITDTDTLELVRTNVPEPSITLLRFSAVLAAVGLAASRSSCRTSSLSRSRDAKRLGRRSDPLPI